MDPARCVFGSHLGIGLSSSLLSFFLEGFLCSCKSWASPTSEGWLMCPGATLHTGQGAEEVRRDAQTFFLHTFPLEPIPRCLWQEPALLSHPYFFLGSQSQ